MKVKEYEQFVVKMAKQPINLDRGMYNMIGLAGETGEVMEWAKKAIYRKDPKYTEDMLLAELGDVLHYLTRIALYYGTNLKGLMELNMQKLEKRHGCKQDWYI